MKLFKKTRERLEKAAPIEKWTGSMNYPFDGYLDKPRPSLSKHEGTKRGERSLHCDDLVWILTARRDMPKLLQALDIAIEALARVKHEANDSSSVDLEIISDEALKKIEAINEEK
jgi:hypothetical protein